MNRDGVGGQPPNYRLNPTVGSAHGLAGTLIWQLERLRALEGYS